MSNGYKVLKFRENSYKNYLAEVKVLSLSEYVSHPRANKRPKVRQKKIKSRLCAPRNLVL